MEIDRLNKILYIHNYCIVYKDNKEIHYEKNIEHDMYYDMYDKIIIRELNNNEYLSIHYHNDYSKYSNKLNEFVNEYMIYESENLKNDKYILSYIGEYNINIIPLSVIKCSKDKLEKLLYYSLNNYYQDYELLPTYIINHYISYYNKSPIYKEEYYNICSSSENMYTSSDETEDIYELYNMHNESSDETIESEISDETDDIYELYNMHNESSDDIDDSDYMYTSSDESLFYELY
jgi:hypothetical protein